MPLDTGCRSFLQPVRDKARVNVGHVRAVAVVDLEADLPVHRERVLVGRVDVQAPVAHPSVVHVTQARDRERLPRPDPWRDGSTAIT